MSHYLHHVPGRLRLKALSFRNSEDKAAEIRALCSQLPGISSIELNTLTGSLLVRYDKASVNSSQILGLLFTNGVITSIPEARPKVTSNLFGGPVSVRAADTLAETVSKLLAKVVIEKMLPRLVSAVI